MASMLFAFTSRRLVENKRVGCAANFMRSQSSSNRRKERTITVPVDDGTMQNDDTVSVL